MIDYSILEINVECYMTILYTKSIYVKYLCIHLESSREMAASGSVSISVMGRVLTVLDDCGTGINRTSLAAKTGLNYGTCVKYLNFLQLLDCVCFQQESGHVLITGTGRGLRRTLQDTSYKQNGGLLQRVSNVGKADGAESQKYGSIVMFNSGT